MSAETALVTIDGSHGEGGGGLVRTALVMSALTQLPVRVFNVRGGTRHPGLDAEDLTLIQALAESTEADTSGISAGNESFQFTPTRKAKGLTGQLACVRNDSNRGPNALVILTALLPVMARSGAYSSITSEGETYGTNALSYDAFARTTLPAMAKVGLGAYPELVQAGFGRESRGEVSIDIEPSALTGIDWSDRGRRKSITAVVASANISPNVAERAAGHLRTLARQANVEVDVLKTDVSSTGPGLFVTVAVEYERGFGGGAAAGTRGLRAEMVAQSAFEEALDWIESGASVDPYLADQLLLPCVLAEGPTVFKVSRLSQRFLTQVWVIKQFLPIHLTVRGSENHSGTVTITR